jgi:hypothetical protein
MSAFDQNPTLAQVERGAVASNKQLRSDPFDAASRACNHSTAGTRVLVMMLRR